MKTPKENKKLHRALIIFSTLLILAIAACVALYYVYPPQVTMVVTEADFAQLERNPNLRRLDLTGSTCYDAIEDYIAAHPEVDVEYKVYIDDAVFDPQAETVTLEGDYVELEEVKKVLPHLPRVNTVTLTQYTPTVTEAEVFRSIYPDVKLAFTVEIMGQRYDPDAVTSLTLKGENVDFIELSQAMRHLRKVQTVQLTDYTPALQELTSFQDVYPGVKVKYTVELLGETYDPDTATEVTLSQLTPEGLEDVLGKLPLLPNLTKVDLVGENETSALSPADVKKMQEAYGDVFFLYRFDLFGQAVSTEDESIVYLDVPIGNEGEAQIRQALDVLTNCTYFKLDDCGIDSKVMASIRDDYPDVKVVWRIYCDKFSMCTDETMLRMTHRVKDTNCYELRYCTDVTYMDIGHNETLTDISFVEFMPNLECVIVSGSAVTDISYFADHDKLEFLELCFCGFLEDISILSTCDNLKYLNVSYSRVSDLSALKDLPMERLNCMHTNVNANMIAQFTQWHPDCLSVFKGVQPYGYGWRYIDQGYTFNDYYKNMRIVFRYDDKNYDGNRKER